MREPGHVLLAWGVLASRIEAVRVGPAGGRFVRPGELADRATSGRSGIIHPLRVHLQLCWGNFSCPQITRKGQFGFVQNCQREFFIVQTALFFLGQLPL